MGNTKSIGVAYSDQDLTGSTITDPIFDFSGLSAVSTPLSGSETLALRCGMQQLAQAQHVQKHHQLF